MNWIEAKNRRKLFEKKLKTFRDFLQDTIARIRFIAIETKKQISYKNFCAIMREVRKEFQESATAKTAIACILTHYLFSWLIVRLFESGNEIATMLGFFWYYGATITTIGYGDITPTDPLGRAVILLFVGLVGIGIVWTFIGIIIAKIAKIGVKIWRCEVRVKRNDHLLIISDQEEKSDRTLAILRGIFADEERKDRDVVLCFDGNKIKHNPFPRIGHGKNKKTVAGSSINDFSDEKWMKNAYAGKAWRIGIDLTNDELSFSLCVKLHKINPRAHIVVTLQSMDRYEKKIAKYVSEDIECVPAGMADWFVSALQDRWSTDTLRDLSSRTGETMYCISIPDNFGTCTYERIEKYFENLGAQLIGLSDKTDRKERCINPAGDVVVHGGMVISYLHKRRLDDEVFWDEIKSKN